MARTALVGQILLGLLWCALERWDFDAATRALEVLDRDFPAQAERISARESLMIGLLEQNRLETYVLEAKKLLRDPTVRPGSYDALVLETVRTTYQRCSRVVCKELIESANVELAKMEPMVSSLALCSCPDSFESTARALEFEEQIKPERLAEISTLMHADALLVVARVREWARDFAAMEASAVEALRTMEEYPAAQYWVARARLHQKVIDPAKGLDLDTVPDQPEWKRLVRELRAYDEPTVPRGKQLIAVLRGEFGSLNEPEVALTESILHGILTQPGALSRNHLARSAELARAAQPFLKCPPWTEIIVSLKEIEIDRLYASASERLARLKPDDRLETPDLPKQVTARALARVARALAGVQGEPDLGDVSDGLAALEAGIWRILGAGEPVTPLADTSLRHRLKNASLDPLYQRFPELVCVTDTVAFALRAVMRDPTVGPEFARAPCPTDAPIWVQWLSLRTAQLCCHPADAVRFAERLDLRQRSLAWFVDTWQHGLPLPVEFTQAKQQHVEAGLGNVAPSDAQAVARYTGEARAAGYHETAGDEKSPRVVEPFAGLGPLCGAVCAGEASLEADYAAARTALAKGTPAVAIGILRRCRSGLDKAASVSSAWWGPVLDYWHGVALAHAASPEARTLLERVLGTSKDAEARSQLALLALRAGTVDEAERWVQDVPEEVPGVLYARALLLSRRGDAKGAAVLLDTRGRELLARPGPYGLAARRLAAALCERERGLLEAAERHRDVLALSPSDAITSARLGRLQLCEAWAQTATEPLSVPVSTVELLRTGATRVPWASEMLLLGQLVTSGDGELNTLRGQLGGLLQGRGKKAWQQVLARRLLQARRAHEAQALLGEQSETEDPAWLMRTRRVLGAWKALSHLSQSPCQHHKKGTGPHDNDGSIPEKVLSDLARWRDEMVQPANCTHDVVLWRWAALLELAQALARSCSRAGPPVPAPPATDDSWPFWQVFRAWSAEPHEQLGAAAALKTALDGSDSVWTPQQQDVLGSATSWLLRQDGDFLARYQKLQSCLEEIPIEPRHVWLAAASIWFERRNWAELLTAQLPACLKDLSMPEVRWLMLLSFIRAAAEGRDLPAERGGRILTPTRMLEQVRELLGHIETTEAENGGR